MFLPETPGMEAQSLIPFRGSLMLTHMKSSFHFAKFETQNLSVSATSLISIVGARDLSSGSLESRDLGIAHLTSEALAGSSTSSSSKASTSTIPAGDNVTAQDLGLADSYSVGLWNYCNVTKTVCALLFYIHNIALTYA